MTASAGGHPLTSIRLCWPRIGLAVAEVRLVDPVQINGLVVVSVLDFSMPMSVVRGEPAANSAPYVLMAGIGWSQPVPARPGYQNDLGVRLRTILQHDADAAHERLDLDPALDRNVGTRYIRMAGIGWDTLGQRRLALPWWVDSDGTTRVRKREQPEVTGRARLLLPRTEQSASDISVDSILAFTPGRLVDGRPIQELIVRSRSTKTRVLVRT